MTSPTTRALFLKRGVRIEADGPHRPQDAPVHGLQAVAHIRQRALRDRGERIGEIALAQGLGELLRPDVVFDRQFAHGNSTRDRDEGKLFRFARGQARSGAGVPPASCGHEDAGRVRAGNARSAASPLRCRLRSATHSASPEERAAAETGARDRLHPPRAKRRGPLFGET